MRPNFNEQCNPNVLTLFRNGITLFNHSAIITTWFIFYLLSLREDFTKNSQL